MKPARNILASDIICYAILMNNLDSNSELTWWPEKEESMPDQAE